eukprot:c11058_g1_i1.p2 GENE.c11058_g1_i1~~c11058_g1_i1.p2  ORF type:complete len:131 (-),score=22.67 c11058_g1_i1:84-476(-)
MFNRVVPRIRTLFKRLHDLTFITSLEKSIDEHFDQFGIMTFVPPLECTHDAFHRLLTHGDLIPQLCEILLSLIRFTGVCQYYDFKSHSENASNGHRILAIIAQSSSLLPSESPRKLSEHIASVALEETRQ